MTAVAAPRTADWMRGTPSMAEAMANERADAAVPTLEDVAWEHLSLLQLLASITGQPQAFTGSIARTAAALGLSGVA